MQKTGRVTVKLNGDTLTSKSGAQIQMGGIEREPDISDQGRSFYMERMIPAQVTCTIIHVADTDLPALRAFKDGTINYETDTGAVYTIGNAFSSRVGELKNGEVEVVFGGDPAEQTT